MASVTLMKARRVLGTRGVRGLASAGWRQLTGAVAARRELREHAAGDDPSELLARARRIGHGLLAPAQIDAEILGLLGEVRRLRPRAVLEIGTANGGTLFLLTRLAAPDAVVISIDLPGGAFGEGYARWRAPLYRRFAVPGQRVELIRADSHQPATRAAVGQLLADRPLDLLFIDGDHSYEGARQDYEMYRDLVRPGGLIGFHDVARHRDATCEVHRLWGELRTKPSAREWIAHPDQGWGGIGAVTAD